MSYAADVSRDLSYCWTVFVAWIVGKIVIDGRIELNAPFFQKLSESGGRKRFGNTSNSKTRGRWVNPNTLFQIGIAESFRPDQLPVDGNGNGQSWNYTSLHE